MANKQLELQARDIALLETVRDLTIISLDQIQSLFWPEAGREVARKRLSHLMNRGQRWLTNFTIPKPEMQAAGLEPGKVYTLDPDEFPPDIKTFAQELKQYAPLRRRE